MGTAQMARRLVAVGRSSPRSRAWGPLVARLALAVVLIPTGIGKFANHAAYVERFAHWGFPAPGAVALLVGTTEVACGVAMLLGILPRVAGPAIVATMAGALLTAGRIDGGMDIWLPVVMGALAVFVTIRGPGRLAAKGP